MEPLTKAQQLAEARYVVRLCQRTARLYRRIQSAGTFVAILGGSAALSAVSGQMPTAVPLLGGLFLALSSAALLAIRPADKAAQNEADIRRYQSFIARAALMDAVQLAVALEEARQGDAPEVEPLRSVAYNDVMLEINRPDQLIPLSPMEKLVRALA